MPSEPVHFLNRKGQKDSELFIGLIAPVGTDLSLVLDVIRASLKRYQYRLSDIRLSELISACHSHKHLCDKTFTSEAERIDKFMTAGNEIRSGTRRGDILALLAVHKVRYHRQLTNGKPNHALSRHAFVFNSLKHPEELRVLRSIYGENFLALSVYSPRAERINYLSKRIGRSCSDSSFDKYRADAEKLLERDAHEVSVKLGQSVGKTFPLADAFIQIQPKNYMQQQLDRIFRIVFGFPYHTPSQDEMAMFYAQAAALRSADLSRQVGAVITRDRGEVVSVGCNEVPRAGGGLLWEGEKPDDRDFQSGSDPNMDVRHWILAEVFEKLSNAGWLNGDSAPKRSEEFVKRSLYEGEEPPLKHTRLANLIEFGRIVHAEMNALTDAVRRGVSVDKGTMYTTTFPCHMCARHLISAGLRRVVFIEPYPKSMASDLYPQSISMETRRDGAELLFEPFVGIAPRRFVDLFGMPDRKDDSGRILAWEEPSAELRLRNPLPTYLDVETAAGQFLEQKSVEFGIEAPHSTAKEEESEPCGTQLK
jgi:deoxycytidylate deaminase